MAVVLAAGSRFGSPRRFRRNDSRNTFSEAAWRGFRLSRFLRASHRPNRAVAIRAFRPSLPTNHPTSLRARVLRARRSRHREPSRGGRFRRAAHPWPARSTLAGRGHARRERVAATGSTRPPLGGSAPSRRLCHSRRRREGAKNLRPAEMVASFGSDPRPPWLFRALPARVAAKDEPGGNRLRSPFPFSGFDPTWIATDSALSSSEVFKRASGRVLSSSLLENSARCIRPIEAIRTPIFASGRKRQTHITVAY